MSALTFVYNILLEVPVRASRKKKFKKGKEYKDEEERSKAVNR